MAEKLNALDKDFAEKNGASADDAAMREKAADAIIIPLAKEVGLPFTLEELKEYEQEQLKEMNLSEDELEQVAGGRKTKFMGSSRKKDGGAYCAFLGVGFGKTERKGNTAYCFLDNRAQAIVTESLNRLKATRLVVAHRLSTIRECSRILVLDQGRIAESGTFDELVEKGGIFAKLAKRQMA